MRTEQEVLESGDKIVPSDIYSASGALVVECESCYNKLHLLWSPVKCNLCGAVYEVEEVLFDE